MTSQLKAEILCAFKKEIKWKLVWNDSKTVFKRLHVTEKSLIPFASRVTEVTTSTTTDGFNHVLSLDKLVDAGNRAISIGAPSQNRSLKGPDLI